MSKLPVWFREGWQRRGPGMCACPRCGDTVSTNALARAAHARGCLGTVPLRRLKEWFLAEKARRTAAVKAGTGKPEWADKNTRISCPEVWLKAAQYGVNMDMVRLRLWTEQHLKIIPTT